METPERQIAHFDLDAFFVSVERLKDPSLNNRPLIVGGHSDRGVVAACSYETRKFGVHSAMPMKQALKLCPEALVIKGDMASYSKYSRIVSEMIENALPVVEKASIDEFYADMTGMDKYFGCFQYLIELKQRITKEVGLPISFALASNKMISKIATNEAKPNGEIHILTGTEKAFLAPMKIEKIPMVGESTAAVLHKEKIFTIGQLADTSIIRLEKILGKNGTGLWYKANGISTGEVEPYSEQKSISSENTFEVDTKDKLFLEQEIARLTEKIAYELREEEKLTGCVTVKIRYENFDTLSRQVTIAYTSSDHLLIVISKRLFNELHDTNRPVRLLGVRFSHLIETQPQLSLFESIIDKPQLYKAIDSLKQKFGLDSVQRAVSLQAKSNVHLRPSDPLWINRNKLKE
jgi:DNA polymerase-4